MTSTTKTEPPERETPRTDALVAEWERRVNALPDTLSFDDMKLIGSAITKSLADHSRELETALLAAERDNTEHAKTQVRMTALVRELNEKVIAAEREVDQCHAKATCMCGSYVKDHGYGDGHGPASMYDYALDNALQRATAAEREREELRAAINTPELHNFLRAVHVEAVHQVERWGTAHDRAKRDSDWFWLVGYLAGKALHSATAGDSEKALHHCISTAASLYNWHCALKGVDVRMCPGKSDLEAVLEDAFGVDLSRLRHPSAAGRGKE